MSQLVVQNIAKEFPTRAEPLVILRDVSFLLDEGGNLAIVGPSGSGKSTLLHTLGTLDAPTKGTVQLAGIDPFALDETGLAQFRNRRIGFIFQDHHLLPQCSAIENVLVPTLANGAASAADIDRAKKLLGRVGLSRRLQHRPAELSGGERQRVAVARALILKPLLLLADEPTGNLDRASAAEIGELLLELPRDERAMLITVTHSADLASRFDRQMELNDGHLVEIKAATASGGSKP